MMTFRFQKIVLIAACFALFSPVLSCTEKTEYMEPSKAAPVVIKASPQFGPSPHTVEFSAVLSPLLAGQEDTALWDFDDGTTSDELSTEHTFQAPGTYAVTLTLKDAGGTEYTPSAVFIIVN